MIYLERIRYKIGLINIPGGGGGVDRNLKRLERNRRKSLLKQNKEETGENQVETEQVR